MLIRPATPADAPALAAIYGDACLHGFGTFEEVPPSPDEMAARLKSVTDRGLPYVVAEVDGEVAALAYAAPFRLRAAYRYTVEDSVYVAPGFKGRGLGAAVLLKVIDACEALGLRQIMAVIGDSDNAGSIGLHRSLGFEIKGVMPAVGFKHGRWVDIVFMQRPLNGGAETLPDGAGLELRGV
ncbi:MAG: N-acetyltransferase family protein [Parcubacteria group bacterium]